MVARVQMIFGESQAGLGHVEKAVNLLTRSRDTFNVVLGPDHPDTLATMRGGAARRALLDAVGCRAMDDPVALLDVAAAVDRLAVEDAGAADLARIHLFAGLSVEEAGEAPGLTPSTAYREWSHARAWPADALAGLDDAP